MAVTPVRTFTLRLTDADLAKVDAKAKELGLTRSGLVRRLFERAGVLEPGERGDKPAAVKPARLGRPQVEPNFKK